MSQPLDLDANANAPVHPAAWQAYCEASQAYGNPSSRHALGRDAKRIFDDARMRIAAVLGASADEIVLTSGGTEAAALAILGSVHGRARPHVVTSRVEHAAVARTLDDMEARGDAEVTRVRPDRGGRVEASSIAAALGPETELVTLVLACNETGVLQPVMDVASICRERGVRLHTDAVQAFGRIPVNVRQLGVDMLSLTGHKLGAVGGIGVLYVRAGTALWPVVVGGGHEGGRRASTENVAGAVALAVALEHLPTESARRDLTRRRDRLEAGLAAAVDAIEVLGGDEARLPNTSCVRFPGFEGDGLMMALDLESIHVSTGSACSSGSVEPSPILLGMGLSTVEAREAVRFSLHSGITDDEIDRTVAATRSVVERLRELRR